MNLGERGSGSRWARSAMTRKGLLQGADGEEAGIGDDAAAVESDEELLRTEVPEGKVAFPSGAMILSLRSGLSCW